MSKFKLSDIGKFKNGLNYSANCVEAGCKMIGVPDFGNRYVANLDDLKEINPAIISDDYLLENDDILFVRSNGNKNLIGRSMILTGVKEKITYSGFCIRFRIESKLVKPLYMLYVLKSPLFRKYFSNTQQTSISNLNQELLGDIEFNIPSIEYQEKIVKTIHSLTLKIKSNKNINDNLAA